MRLYPTVLPLLLLAPVLAGCQLFGGGTQAEIEALAATNPPPGLSERPLGVEIVDCDVATVQGPGEVEGETFDCGVYTVPMDWEDPEGPRIDLAFLVARATGGEQEANALVFVAGGPGQSSVLTSLGAYDELRPSRDIVRLDQRGTGLSNRLGLEECLVLAARDEASEDDLGLLIEATRKAAEQEGDVHDPHEAEDSALVASTDVGGVVDRLCARLFQEQGLALEAFDTVQSARDLIGLMDALGYEGYDLHGVSYGTRLALEVLRQLQAGGQEGRVGAVVLDSPFPPQEPLLSTLPRNLHDPVLQLFEDCAADPDCADAYPDLPARFGALYERLADMPVEAEGVTVTAENLRREILTLRNSRAGFMPRMIAELEAGETATYRGLASGDLGRDDPEDESGIDRSDPLQAFLADAATIAGSAGEMTQAFAIVGGVAKALEADDPLAAMETFFQEETNGEVQEALLARLAQVGEADLEASETYRQIREELARAETPSEDERRAAEERSKSVLARIGLAHLLNKNIQCRENYAFETLEDGLSALEALRFPGLADEAFLREQAATCEAWPVAAAPAAIKEPVRSDVPALILQGAYDTRTPVFMGRDALEGLPRGTLALVPQQGHEVWTNAQGCVGRIGTAFLQDPDAAPDLSCLDTRRPRWSLPGEPLEAPAE